MLSFRQISTDFREISISTKQHLNGEAKVNRGGGKHVKNL